MRNHQHSLSAPAEVCATFGAKDGKRRLWSTLTMLVLQTLTLLGAICSTSSRSMHDGALRWQSNQPSLRICAAHMMVRARALLAVQFRG